MSKILLGILTAHHPSRWWYRTAARQNYLKGSELDHLFVFGRAPVSDWPVEQQEDELWADCDDRKEFMVYKNQALFRYALDHGYDYCLRACDDTFLFPDRIVKAGLEPFDYSGQMPCKFSLGGTFKVWMGGPYSYMHGGAGIWLSRKAMQMLVDDRLDSIECDMPEKVDVGMGLITVGHKIWWDDLWIGEVLKGRLPWDSPLRANPVEAYHRNGITVFEDEMMFDNSDPMRPIAIHDPGVHKINSKEMDELVEQVKKRNVAMAQMARAQEASHAV